MRVVKHARKRPHCVCAGVFTPSEIDADTQAGAEVVKPFPASSHTPNSSDSSDRHCLTPGLCRLERLPGRMPAPGSMPEQSRSESALTSSATAETGDYSTVRTSAREWLEIIADPVR